MKPAGLVLLTFLGFLAVPGLNAAEGQSEITEVGQIAEVLPRETLLAMKTAKKDAAVLQATEVLHDKVEGREATLKFKLERIEKDQDRDASVNRYRVKAEDIHLNKGGVMFTAYVWVHFDASESAQITALKKGAQITVTGKVTLASISVSNSFALHIDLSEAKLK